MARRSLRRTLTAAIAALVILLVVIPLVYDLRGLRTNLEEVIAPTLVARVKLKTRTPAVIGATEEPAAETPVPVTEGPRETPTALNGVPVEKIIFISESTREHLRDIFAQGQEKGRNARSVSKVGDSTMVYPAFLAVFDEEAYRLGRYAYLQETIEYHAGSFGRVSAAVKKGMHTWSQFDPAWAVPELCLDGEGPLECEVRVANPGVAIIRLGANDTEFPSMFEKNLRGIVAFCLARGIIPILGTKPDRHEGPSNQINQIIRRTAESMKVPLWDYDLIAATVPGRGLEPDGVHMRAGGTRDFASPAAMRAGDSLEDLTALMMLDAVRREVQGDAAQP